MDGQVLICLQRVMAGGGKTPIVQENMYCRGSLKAQLPDSQEETFSHILSWQGCIVGYAKHIFGHCQVFFFHLDLSSVSSAAIITLI